MNALALNTQREAIDPSGRASAPAGEAPQTPTSLSFGGLERGEEVIAKPATSTQRYAGHPEAERALRIRHELQFETRLRRQGLREIRWKCTHCHKGSVTISGHYNAQGRMLTSSGLCSTPGCLDWGN